MPTIHMPFKAVTQDTIGAVASQPDLHDGLLSASIEAQGARLAWSIGSVCPCVPLSETDQPDPTCPECEQSGGWIYEGPRNYVPPAEVGELDPLQESLIQNAGVIRGIVAAVTQNSDLANALGNWTTGDLLLSVRPENRLGYYDKIVALDSEMAYSETIPTRKGRTGESYLISGPTLPTNFPVISVRLLKDHLHRRYEVGEDFEVSSTGVVTWLPGMAPTTPKRFSINYLAHPTYLITDFPHAFREIARRQPDSGTIRTPFGEPTKLPIRARIRLQHLPKERQG